MGQICPLDHQLFNRKNNGFELKWKRPYICQHGCCKWHGNQVITRIVSKPLRWRHNERHGVSNHQPYDCLLNRLFRCRSKKTSKLRVTGFCGVIYRWPVNSPDKGPLTRKVFPFDDAIMPHTDSTTTLVCPLKARSVCLSVSLLQNIHAQWPNPTQL